MEIMTDIQTKRPTNRHTNQPVNDEQKLQSILKNDFVETKDLSLRDRTGRDEESAQQDHKMPRSISSWKTSSRKGGLRVLKDVDMDFCGNLTYVEDWSNEKL